MAAVEDLVSRATSGILEVTGNPSGAIYLDGGRIVFVRVPWVPGLAARLRGISPGLTGLRELPAGQEADDAAVAGLALQRGYLTVPALHELIQSIVVDAFLVLTVPLAMDAPVAAIRFTSTRTYWTEIFPRFGIELVRGKALKTAERITQYGLTPTTEVAPCRLRRPAAVLSREQWAVACQIGDRSSARDLAARRGAALIDTLDCLGGLTKAGLCAPVRAAGHARAAGAPGPGRSPGAGAPSGAGTVARLPARDSGPDHQARAWQAAGAGQPPTEDILRQVLNGLRKLT
jgi:hypothetical protein